MGPSNGWAGPSALDALIKADKPFDLLVIPGAGHTSGGDYGEHKRFDFFVQHLLDARPPRWSELTPAPEATSGAARN